MNRAVNLESQWVTTRQLTVGSPPSPHQPIGLLPPLAWLGVTLKMNLGEDGPRPCLPGWSLLGGADDRLGQPAHNRQPGQVPVGYPADVASYPLKAFGP